MRNAKPSHSDLLSPNSKSGNTSLQVDYLINIFHELRTPLSIILGAIKLIEMEQCNLQDTRIPKHIQIIKVNCYRLLRLINNILDLTKLDNKYVSLEPVSCNIVKLTRDIAHTVAPIAEEREISMQFSSSKEEIITAIDIDKFEKIILNLLSNAIKFTGKGGKIEIRVEDADNRVFIHVKDSGIGIPKSKQKAIFSRYMQSKSPLSRDNEGTGIGLALVKHFVELHGGSINLISKVRYGSDFIVELPIVTCVAGLRKKVSEESQSCQEDRLEKIIKAINIELSYIYTSS